MFNNIKRTLLTGLLLGTFIGLSAQNPINADRAVAPTDNENGAANSTWKPSLFTDGVIDRVEHEYKVLPWRSVREIDVAWAQRVWSIVPVKEKQNMPFLFPGDEFTNGGAFIEILNHAISTGEIQAFNGIDDRFTLPLDKETFEKAIGNEMDTEIVINPITLEETQQIIKKEFNINHVTKYIIKEDWIFDRNMGRMVKYIIGIAPMKDVYDEASNTYQYSTPMYWIYYPKAREVLGKYEVFNPDNLVKRMTWTDYLEGGYYSSYVEKTSKNNPLGERIKDDRSRDLRGLIEGENVIYDLINKEQDMWER